ncbi:hypothetical protein ABZ357_10305 [Streptomyces sp. NPDC005917]|uniref:hypothetical protein n=1 Tax=unclassified Streptomyces TaxID=2593676 RepID=UPI0033F14775
MDAHEEATRGLTDIENYLYREAHLRAAYRRVAQLTARVPGLTQEQKRNIESWYLDDQRDVAHVVTEHIADSISVIEERHHARFGSWRRGTLIAMALITTLLIGVCLVVTLSTTR